MFKKPIVILIDEGCASACETALEAFETHLHATTIGQRTAGMVHFGNVGLVGLPNSRVVVNMATDFWKYKDGGQ